MTCDTKSSYIKKAGIIALVGNIILATEKIIFSSLSSSIALLGDGLDSASDVLLAILTLVIGKIISKPCDKEHPWGHQRSESVATLVLSLVIFYCGSQLIISSIKKLISHSFVSQMSIFAIIASIISITGKIFLALTQRHYAKKSGSSILKANAENMKSDIILSSGVLLGLSASKLFSCPVLDPIVAILVGLWVIKNSITLFLEINVELMDGNLDDSLYEKIFNAAKSVKGVENPHKARIRKISSAYDVDLDFEVDPNMTVFQAHELMEEVEEAIRKEIPEIYEIQIHVEPLGSDCHQRTENYGISPKENHIQGNP